MVKFRKNKSDAGKHDSIKQNFHIPEKDAVSIVPPKKVIKALYDYDAPTNPPHYLSFSQGDFLHVVAREDDQDWYEACNPLQGTRGLVPVKYFETVGKTVRDSRGSTHSAPHDSGYADSTKGTPANNGPGPAAIGHRQSKSLGRMGVSGGGAMVYGIVAYDFHAERPDELDAKEGEAIIVIAQSNPEWFVAKPITRLGGPGLIPVSFIEIKDMNTGATVSDTQEAIARAGIPRVEEWKKMAADYKNTSIPLGTIGGPSGHSPSASQSGIQQGMNRMSLNNQSNGHARGPSNFQQQPPLIFPANAAVPSFIYADEKFHFIVECTTSDGSHWNLSRIYEDFYELQINLIKAFPDEAGQTGQQRTLPYMPGPVQFVTDKISEGRRENLDEYLQHLLRLGPHITKSSLVCGFFAPRAGDDKVDVNDGAPPQSQGTPSSQSQRFSQPAHRAGPSQSYSPKQPSYSNSQQHQRQLSSAANARPSPQNHFRNPSEFSQHSAGAVHPPSMQRQMTNDSANPSTLNQGAANGATGGAALKVKVWFDRDTCVVVRMPPKGTFRFPDLYRKIVERRKLEYNNKKDSGVDEATSHQLNGPDDQILEIEYRDERDGEYYKLADDEELATALDSNEKLTLVVREVVT